MKEETVDKLRGVVRDCVSKHLYSSAIFFADKVAAFNPADITTPRFPPSQCFPDPAVKADPLCYEALECLIDNHMLTCEEEHWLTLNHLKGNFNSAITYYHKALWIKPDDKFCTDMLTEALVDECRNGLDD
ncbi:hypothetical protein GIB67_016126 [Kingdonia uniflora]|uniref:Uncharacterized protein n=1 Tax=Kingdonia uniflora TaxID=39325 RepID=A0A7J7L201_9MAGN|nr:hypothetical protein GIB67_016126 [Kingdonia uniflora]